MRQCLETATLDRLESRLGERLTPWSSKVPLTLQVAADEVIE